MTEINNNNSEPLLQGLGGSLAISAAITRGFGAVPAIKTARAAQAAGVATPSQVVNELLKQNSAGDTFSRSIAAARNYEKYSDIVRKATKAAKRLEKLQTKGPSLWQRITNLGKSSADIVSECETVSKNLTQAASTMSERLKKGQEILDIRVEGAKGKTLIDAANNILEQAPGTTFSSKMKCFGTNAARTFKFELCNMGNVFYAISSSWSRIQRDALPAFKNEGIGAGIKKTFGAIGKSIVDVFSNAGFSTAFRMFGTWVGRIGGSVGSAIGGTIGDIVGTFVSNKVISKAFHEDDILTSTQEVAKKGKDTVGKYRTDTASPDPNHPLSHLSGQALYDYADAVKKRADSHKHRSFYA